MDDNDKTKEQLIDELRDLKLEMSLMQSILDSPTEFNIFALDKNYSYTLFTKSHKVTMKSIWTVDIHLGMDMTGLISNVEDRVKAKENFDRAIKGEHFILTEEYGDQSLNRVTYENYYYPVKDPEGNNIGVSVFVMDATERIEAGRTLKISEEKYRTIFENVLDAYYEATVDGTLLEISPSIESISKGQYKNAEMIGKPFDNVYENPDDQKKFFSELFKKGKSTEYELSLKIKDG